MNAKTTQPPPPNYPGAELSRQRVTVDVPPGLLSLLDNYSEVTGQARAAVVLALLVAHLPALNDQAQDLRKRAQQLQQQGHKK